MGSRDFDFILFTVSENNAVFRGVRFRKDLARGTCDKRVSPELDMVFQSNTIGCDDKNAIGNGVTPHHRLPRVNLGFTVLLFVFT